jgi:hypothetical protein
MFSSDLANKETTLKDFSQIIYVLFIVCLMTLSAAESIEW